MQMLLNVFAPVLIAYQPDAKRQNRSSKRKKLLSVRRRHIHDHQLSHDRKQRDEDDVRTCTAPRWRSAITRRHRSNSSAMITVKIIPKTA
jgi:hypothetical protein